MLARAKLPQASLDWWRPPGLGVLYTGILDSFSILKSMRGVARGSVLSCVAVLYRCFVIREAVARWKCQCRWSARFNAAKNSSPQIFIWFDIILPFLVIPPGVLSEQCAGCVAGILGRFGQSAGFKLVTYTQTPRPGPSTSPENARGLHTQPGAPRRRPPSKRPYLKS